EPGKATADEHPVDGGGATGSRGCGQPRKILQSVRPRVAVPRIIGRYSDGCKINPQFPVGEHGIRENGIAGTATDEHPIAAVKGDGVTRAAFRAPNGVIARRSKNEHAIEGVAQSSAAVNVGTDVVALHPVPRRSTDSDDDPGPVVARDEVTRPGLSAPDRIVGR